ncbi:MAG: TetR/AcrR family transcriptional regulator [Ignavibacteria bacterium]|nr:TetR/AcrR family transcriptional regulator [Ignavibacteria bacterium]
MNKILSNSEDRLKILKYSRKKFHSEGFYKTSMDEIAGELHVSKKTIYKYFPSKEKLLEEICSDTSCEITDKVETIVEGNEDVVVKFVKLLNMHSNVTMNISEKWLNDLTIHAPQIKKNIDEMKNEQINKVLRKLLEQGKKENLIENFPTPIIIKVFNTALVSVLNPEFLINNKFSLQNAFKITYEMLLNGILTKSGKEKFKKTKALLAKEIKL